MAYDAEHFTIAEVLAPPSVTQPERIRILRDAILRTPEDFNMSHPDPHKCGTPVCFFGWARELFFKGERATVAEVVRFLGLTPVEGRDLFCMGDTSPNWAVGSDPFNATAIQGARLLDHYLATGEVDWSVA